MKGTKLEDFIASLPQEEQDAIEEEYLTLKAEHMALQEIRKSVGMTQEEMANCLDTKQHSVSALENRSDIHLSTLRRYIEALGGTMHIMIALPDKPLVELSGLFKE